jgi:hypothetical protein
VSRFAPVFLPPGRELDGRVSVTFGRAENVCSRAGYLYALHKGEATGHPLETGSALHRILELGTRAAVENGEPMIPPEIVKAICNEVFADPAYRCPIEEHDRIREAAYRWAEEATFDATTLIACETLFVLDVGGFEMRGKIDRADLIEAGAAVAVNDYKSSRAMPSYEALGRVLRDGRIAAKAYQLVLYALLLAFGVPVRIETCAICGGRGTTFGLEDGHPGGTALVECVGCGGRGTVEVREPFGVAEQAQRFDLAFVFPGIDADGRMGRRELSLTRLELHELRASLHAQLARVEEAQVTGDWPATSGTHCNECACRPECPIPGELRDFAGTINTEEEAVEAAEQLWMARKLHQARWDEIKRFVKTAVPGQRLRFGRDQVIEPTTVVKNVIRDKDGMRAAIERARTTGEPYVHADWEKKQVSTPIAQRSLSEEELAEEAEQDNHIINSEGSNS